MKDWKI